MNISCLVGKGEMPHEDCLKCARDAILPPCRMEYSFLRAMYEVMGSGDRSKEIHVTDLTHECMRKTYLDKTNSPVEDAARMMARFKGISQHDFLESKNAWAIPEQEIEWDGVKGRTDVMYESNGQMVLVDYKTAKQIYSDRLPYGEHELQLNIYAYMLEKLGKKVDRLVLVYIGNNGPTECSKCKRPVEYHLGMLVCPTCGREPRDAHFGVVSIEVPKMPAKEVEKIFRDRKMQLEKALADKKEPEPVPGWLCSKYCSHTQCEYNGMSMR